MAAGKKRAKKSGKGISPAAHDTGPSSPAPSLLGDLQALIESARTRVAVGVNAEMVMLYWDIGERIHTEILGDRRAAYGKQVVNTVSDQLTMQYGRGFTRANLFHMLHFVETFPERKIVYSLSRQLSWTHFRNIIYIEDSLAREFYTEMCRLELWSVRTLQAKIQGMLFERTALSKKPEELARKELAALRDEDRVTPDLVFRSPYFLEFLGLSDTVSEKDLENSILRELERFILELGTDFSFVARQKRITVDTVDYYIDLLFYHRKLRRLVAIDLKLGKFKAADKGQVELYLRWLDKYDRQPGEEAPIGLVLCAGSSVEHVELLELEASSIRVAEYLTELPPREVLVQKLKSSVAIARERLAARTMEKEENMQKGDRHVTGNGA
ncbi:MAG: PDDEXK nuclease domain-containing protein [Methanomicrobiales archaeon]|jgi:predicted nuclease of restriction endonuclease-like (RecB) superfamily|nr:PDDEXK nuclease domain-containing protein [Methanomicrobiales archaeon]